MKKIKNKYRLIQVLLIYGFMINFLTLHFLFENNIMCRIGGKVFVENININGTCEHNSKILKTDRNYYTNAQCQDYQLVKHTDDFRITNQKNTNGHNCIPYLSKQISPSNNKKVDSEITFRWVDYKPYSIKVITTSTLLI